MTFFQMVLFLALGGAAATLLVPPTHDGVYTKATPTPRVTLDGKVLALDGTEADALEAARAIARAYLSQPLALRVQRFGHEREDVVPDESETRADAGVKQPDAPIEHAAREFVRAREDFGASIDLERLTSLIRQVRDARSPLRRAHYRKHGTSELALPLPVAAVTSRALPVLLTAKDELDQPPIDAKYSLAKRTITEDEPGTRMDPYATLARLDAALSGGAKEVEAASESVPARRTKKALGTVVVDDVLGYFETKYARDWSHQARAYNLKLAASKVDGHVMMPGEVFDFNEVVGPRSEAYGYKVASVIAQGEVVDGIGGGTCQISGTLHGAAIFSGLEIVERRPHTRPSFYIKMGMDATVVYPTITMKLRNPFTFPVVLRETLNDGVVRAEILGPKRTRDVTFVRRIDDVVPFNEKETVDPSVPKDERVLVQRGIPGFRITRYRVIREGAFAVRERMPDSYPSTAQIWKVGSGAKDPDFKPKDDSHPEYVADQTLTISQGPSIAGYGKGGGMAESRYAGKYGSYGWTYREGLSKYRDRAPKPSEDKPSPD
jgi:vancomycin resistance protein YoaR